MELVEAQALAKGFELLGWRDPPQKKSILGRMALAALPTIKQAFLHHPTLRGDELEEALYSLRRSIQGDILDQKATVREWSYFASLVTHDRVQGHGHVVHPR